MIFAFDLDGSADTFPREFQALMCALKDAGHCVQIVTGIPEEEITPAIIEAKKSKLAGLGMAESYCDLVVIAGPEDRVPARKAEYLCGVGAAMLFDNRRDNMVAAADAGVPLCLLTWQSQTS
jgi:hypothetical protein